MQDRLSALVTTVAAVTVVGVLCLVRRDEVGDALAAVSPWLFMAAVGLHVATLGLRSEAWRLALASASGGGPPRRAVHAANAAAFVAGSVQSQAALPARVVMLRRVAGTSAPPAAQIWIADVPIAALELCVTSLLLVVAALTGHVPWWIALGAAALATSVLLGARWAPARFAHRPAARGLAVLADRRRRGPLVALVTAIASLTAVRVWLVLSTCGLPHGLGEVALMFAALGVFGLLPLGPSGPSGAALATAGAAGLGAAVAAGLMLAASSIIAVAGYALLVALVARVPLALRPGLAR